MALVEFTLADGSKVLVETDGPALAVPVDESPQPGESLQPGESGRVPVRGWRDHIPGARIAQAVEVSAGRTFEQAIDTVRPAAESLVNRLRSVADGPDEVTVEFGLQMSAEAGAYIAKAATAANFTVTMTWRRRER